MRGFLWVEPGVEVKYGPDLPELWAVKSNPESLPSALPKELNERHKKGLHVATL